MGMTNATCAVSGLPIIPGDNIVVIPLEHCPFDDAHGPGEFLYIPRGLPIPCEYKGYPRKLSVAGPTALIHSEVWRRGNDHWEEADSLEFPADAICDAHASAAETTHRIPGLHADDTMFFSMISFMRSGGAARDNEAWWALLRMFTAGKKVSYTVSPVVSIIVAHNAFARAVCEAVSARDDTLGPRVLRKLLGLWMGQRLLGRYITPMAPPAGQDPEYAARLGIMRMHLAIGVGLKKDYDDAVLASDDEEAALSISDHPHPIPASAQLVSDGRANLRLFRCRYCGDPVNNKADGTPLPCQKLACPADIRPDPYAHVFRVPEQDAEVPLFSVGQKPLNPEE